MTTKIVLTEYRLTTFTPSFKFKVFSFPLTKLSYNKSIPEILT